MSMFLEVGWVAATVRCTASLVAENTLMHRWCSLGQDTRHFAFRKMQVGCHCQENDIGVISVKFLGTFHAGEDDVKPGSRTFSDWRMWSPASHSRTLERVPCQNCFRKPHVIFFIPRISLHHAASILVNQPCLPRYHQSFSDWRLIPCGTLWITGMIPQIIVDEYSRTNVESIFAIGVRGLIERRLFGYSWSNSSTHHKTVMLSKPLSWRVAMQPCV